VILVATLGGPTMFARIGVKEKNRNNNHENHIIHMASMLLIASHRIRRTFLLSNE